MTIRSVKTMEHYGSKPLSFVRLFIRSSRSNPVTELFDGKRFNKPHKAYRKEVLPIVMAEQMIPEGTKAVWSQNAGCSCGCSPGFILDIHPAKLGYDAIFVTLY